MPDARGSGECDRSVRNRMQEEVGAKAFGHPLFLLSSLSFFPFFHAELSNFLFINETPCAIVRKIL